MLVHRRLSGPLLGGFTAILAVSTSAGPCGAEEAVRVLDTEILSEYDRQLDDRQLLVRGAVQVSGFPQERFVVWFHAHLGPDQPLLGSDSQAIAIRWGELFTTASPDPDRWTDLRALLPLDAIASAANLPGGRRVLVFVTCDVWSEATGDWAGGGWEVRTPLVVELDVVGKISSWESFHTYPFAPDESWGFAGTKPVRECDLALDRLGLAPGASAVRAVGVKHTIHDLLYQVKETRNPDGTIQTRVSLQTPLDGPRRGFFFGPIESPEEARELFELGHPGARIVPTRAAYEDLVRRLTEIGWRPTSDLVEPVSYGIEIVEVPELGWRVRALLADAPRPGYPEGVAWIEANVGLDGRMDERIQLAIDPDYEHVVGPAAAEGAWPTLPRRLRVTGGESAIEELQAEVDAYLPVDQWPEFASRD